ncbi:hypothetical protein B9Z19DRAFT_1104911 [Tuber borchii]|uniref:Uncharacterized protein n=1 Tax=Tuber borchii TaxID=42251 RepID=A0A2T7A7R3_TUBBO|nr:hypothetical protein B9Z19DRAFT_1104911 [Tuber borchii]
MGTMTDWISAICSLVAAVVALITLLTVYQASIQILNRRQLYHLGLSKNSLGPWRSVVASSSILRMQTQIMTPTLSVPLLVSKRWEPKISYPVGFELGLKGTEADLEAGGVALARASWVNFLEGLGVSPEDDGDFYEMRYESELVNGIVPMRWEGRDLAAICSILGFQSIGSKPNAGKLMELPTQWCGPLGWLQFRASSEGCIVEYRRRSVIKNQLSQELHDYYKGLDVGSRPFKLKSRLWQSISGMCFSDQKVISLSDASEWAEKMRNREENAERPFDEACEVFIECEEKLTDDRVMGILFGKKANRPEGLQPEAFKNGMSQLSPQHTRGISDLLNSEVKGIEDNSKKMVVLYPSRGHLAVSTEGELVHSRGLEKDDLYEYSYIYRDEDEVGVYEHKLGRLCMDMELLKHMKEAILEIGPDGFYFSPSKLLNFQVAQIWSHACSVSERCLDQKCILPIDSLELSAGEEAKKHASGEELYYAIKLINNFQLIKSTSRAMFTTADMVLISRASVSLRRLIGSGGKDLIWAILASPELFDRLLYHITNTTMKDLLDFSLTCKSGRFDLKLVKCSEPEAGQAADGIKVELVEDGTFEGIQVVAALMDVFLNLFWIDRSWVTDVALYDTTMPQSVTMC